MLARAEIWVDDDDGVPILDQIIHEHEFRNWEGVVASARVCCMTLEQYRYDNVHYKLFDRGGYEIEGDLRVEP